MHKIFCYQCYLSQKPVSPCVPLSVCCGCWTLRFIQSHLTLGTSSSVRLTWSKAVELAIARVLWCSGLLAFAAVLVTSSRPSAIRWPRKRFLSWSASAADGAGGIRCREGFTCRLCGCKTSCLLDLAGRLLYGLHDCRLASDQEQRPVGTSVFLLCGVTDDCLF